MYVLSTSHHVWHLMSALEALAFISGDKDVYITKIIIMQSRNGLSRRIQVLS